MKFIFKMNLKYLTIGLGLTILYFTPSYIIKKYIDNTNQYFIWKLKIINDEIKDLKQKILKEDENKDEEENK
jgi:hypothetical protein